MKILWICNIMLPVVAKYLGLEASNKEGWLTGLSDKILLNQADNHIELAVAFPAAPEGEVKHWVVPLADSERKLRCYGFAEDVTHPECYPHKLEAQLEEIVKDYQPDVVHCFGTEFPHTLAATRVCNADKVLIGIQGLCKLYAESYLADLPERVVKRITFRDWLKKDSILEQERKFQERGRMEVLAVQSAGHVTGRTWIDEKFTTETNPEVKYHFMNETLRSNFYEGSWKAAECEPYSIFLSQGDYPIKGLHYMLKAMPAILKKYPQAKIYVAGNRITAYQTLKDKIKISSYGKYILELLQEYELQEKVVFLGRMNAEEMKAQYLRSSMFVCPSVIENSPNSLGEAMVLGVPCVTALCGGVPSIFTDGVDGIGYPGYGAKEYQDAADKEQAQADRLAQAVIAMWGDEARRVQFTKNASEHAKSTHDGQANYERLIEIYTQIAGR